MHWGHATSTDLVHWKEQPIAFYPDANGAMFSGSIVADPKNTSGLFDNGEGGLVALITADGNGQRIKLAYSKDEGRTWTKVDQVAADWTPTLETRGFAPMIDAFITALETNGANPVPPESSLLTHQFCHEMVHFTK